MINLWPVQQAIFVALTAAPATYPVYDAVPQGALFPYIKLGPWDALTDLDLSAPSSDASLLIHAWSRSAGMSQAHAILEFIRARLDNKPITGAWACSEDAHDVIEDPTSTSANRLYHGWARYRLRAG